MSDWAARLALPVVIAAVALLHEHGEHRASPKPRARRATFDARGYGQATVQIEEQTVPCEDCSAPIWQPCDEVVH